MFFSGSTSELELDVENMNSQNKKLWDRLDRALQELSDKKVHHPKIEEPQNSSID